MVAAISSVLDACLNRSKSAAKAWHQAAFCQVPILNRETKRRINHAKAMPVFTELCQARNHQAVAGRTNEIRKAARHQDRIGVGLRGIARETGLGISTVRRQVRRLADLGLVVVVDAGLTHVADPATGKITANRKGRATEAVVYLTITEEHLKPPRSGGSKMNPPVPGNRVQNEPTFKEGKTQRRPAGDAVGIGTPAANQAGRHPPAKAGQEGAGASLTPDRQDNHQRPATVPDGPTASNGDRPAQEPIGEEPRSVGHLRRPEETGRHPDATPERPASCVVAGRDRQGVAGNASVPDGSGMDRRHGSWLAEYRRLSGRPAVEPSEPPPAATEAVEASGVDADAAVVQAAIEAVLARQREDERLAAAAKASAYREAYHQERDAGHLAVA